MWNSPPCGPSFRPPLFPLPNPPPCRLCCPGRACSPALRQWNGSYPATLCTPPQVCPGLPYGAGSISEASPLPPIRLRSLHQRCLRILSGRPQSCPILPRRRSPGHPGHAISPESSRSGRHCPDVSPPIVQMIQVNPSPQPVSVPSLRPAPVLPLFPGLAPWRSQCLRIGFWPLAELPTVMPPDVLRNCRPVTPVGPVLREALEPRKHGFRVAQFLLPSLTVAARIGCGNPYLV